MNKDEGTAPYDHSQCDPMAGSPLSRLILIGCGGHARSLVDIIESGTPWQIQGFIGQRSERNSSVLGYPVLGSDEELGTLRSQVDHALLALGHLGSVERRRALANLMEALGFQFPKLISAHAIVSRHALIGPGSTIGHGAIVNAGAVIGSHCIINSRALIEHDVVIGDHCHISTGALVNGGVNIGANSFIGSGCMIREGLVLPSDTIISAGKRIMGWPLSKD